MCHFKSFKLDQGYISSHMLGGWTYALRSEFFLVHVMFSANIFIQDAG